MGRTIGIALLGAIGFAMTCEALFRCLPVSSATKMGYYVDATIATYAPRHDLRYSTGWDLRNARRLKTNGFGFVSLHEFARDESAVALIGDSYVESASLEPEDRIDARLEQALGNGRVVYAMGVAGTALLDYAERVRFARDTFGIRDFVVFVERGDVRQSLCDSGNVHSQCLDPRTLAPRTVALGQPSPLKLLVRESAFARYLVGQLKVEPAALWRQAFGSPTPAAPSVDSQPPTPAQDGGSASLERDLLVVEIVARTFLERVKPYVAGRLVIVVDSARSVALRRRAADDPARRRFIELTSRAGAIVIDTEPLFRQHFERSALALEIGPYDGHLNPLAVGLVARQVADALKRSTP